jgi:hypothetical protein
MGDLTEEEYRRQNTGDRIQETECWWRQNTGDRRQETEFGSRNTED